MVIWVGKRMFETIFGDLSIRSQANITRAMLIDPRCTVSPHSYGFISCFPVDTLNITFCLGIVHVGLPEVYLYMYIYTGVCVYHLNRCKTSLFFFLLSSPFLIIIIMQGATGSLHGCRQRSSMQLTRIWSLINSTYLPFSGIARGQAQNPKHNDLGLTV